jgi:hypothetical protein
MEYGKKTMKNMENENSQCRTWEMARKLKKYGK